MIIKGAEAIICLKDSVHGLGIRSTMYIYIVHN